MSSCTFQTKEGVLGLVLVNAPLRKDLSRFEDTLSNFRAMQEQARSPQLELDIARVEKEIGSYPQEKLCYEGRIRDGSFIQHALSFYRLMVVWLVDLVGGFKMPLPLTCPMEFACMPKHFIEDALELRQLCQEDANNRPTMSNGEVNMPIKSCEDMVSTEEFLSRKIREQLERGNEMVVTLYDVLDELAANALH
ncbi:hypothetical protein Syun_021008 [Stephania yunnanensis]|uniref:Ubiquitin conjugation factor E4 core domain-containing protein n=1 Tax=Stephania yunnanensis TaxID=152371 RepID=A0AAP0IG98_9MAGN